MKTRAITGFFFLIVMIGSHLLGHYVFGAFYLLLCLLCLKEFYGLIKESGNNPNQAVGLINGALIYIAFAMLTYSSIFAVPAVEFSFPVYKFLFLLPLTLSGVFIAELFKKSASPFSNIAYTFLGLILTILPFTFFHALAYLKGSFNFHFPLGFFIMLWSNDTGAYLTGRAFGRTKLFERHSPKKTWEGFFGGMLISMGAGFILSRFWLEISPVQWIIVGGLIATFGTLGDLVESMFKRSINVKDSGGILPGHGGLLDRFDGLLIAAPVVYTFLYWVCR